MFLHDFAYVAKPASEVRACLEREHGGWLSPLAHDAAVEGDALRVRIGPLGGVPVLSKTHRIEIGAPFQRGDVTVLPLTWHATGVRQAFPILNADLEVAALGTGQTQLSLLGRYDPPLGAVGRGLDRLLLHRIAEASVRSFLQRVCLALDRAELPVAPTPVNGFRPGAAAS